MTQAKPSDICQIRCFNAELVTQVGEALPGDDLLENAQTIFGALADKSRLKILHALSDGQELCVCDVASLLEVKIASASHHLRKLRDLKILKYRNDGKLAVVACKKKTSDLQTGRFSACNNNLLEYTTDSDYLQIDLQTDIPAQNNCKLAQSLIRIDSRLIDKFKCLEKRVI